MRSSVPTEAIAQQGCGPARHQGSKARSCQITHRARWAACTGDVERDVEREEERERGAAPGMGVGLRCAATRLPPRPLAASPSSCGSGAASPPHPSPPAYISPPLCAPRPVPPMASAAGALPCAPPACPASHSSPTPPEAATALSTPPSTAGAGSVNVVARARRAWWPSPGTAPGGGTGIGPEGRSVGAQGSMAALGVRDTVALSQSTVPLGKGRQGEADASGRGRAGSMRQ